MSTSRIGGIGTAGMLLVTSMMCLNIGCTSGTARRDDLVAAPLNTDNGKIAAGRAIFAANCNECHPGGAAGLGPSLNNRPLLMGITIKRQVRRGYGAMPKFSERRISNAQLDALVGYVEAMRGQPVQVAKK
jgi:mono/diheme cytochrome c family protein